MPFPTVWPSSNTAAYINQDGSLFVATPFGYVTINSASIPHWNMTENEQQQKGSAMLVWLKK